MLPHPLRPKARFALLAIGLLLGIAPLPAAQAAAAGPAALPPPVLLRSNDNAGAVVYPFLPAAKNNTGAAVLVVATGDEGAPMARWLNARGLAGFVLLPRPPADAPNAAVADVTRAVQYLRAHAAEFKISPRRIATLGFGRGAEWVADAAYNHQVEARAESADPVEKFSSRPELVALIWGSALPQAGGATPPPTFLAGSTRTADGMSGMVDLWSQLRTARVPVDAHLFAQASPNSGLAADNPSLSSWPESFHAWARFQGLLTDEHRVALKGMVYLDGRVLPHGYVIFTPVDFVGAGPVIGRVINSTANLPLGLFSVPADQGPIAGRYKVDVRQNMNRWMSNAFSGDLVNSRNGVTPEQAYFGHHRVLSPSIDDQHSFTKVHPTDQQDYIVEIKPGADANLDLKIEVFSK